MTCRLLYITTVFVLLTAFKVQSQNFNFFEVYEKEVGISFSYSLIQPKIDSIEVIEKDGGHIYEHHVIKLRDTLFFKNFRVLSDEIWYQFIAEFADTTHHSIVVNEARKRMPNVTCKHKLYAETVPKFPKMDRWIPLDTGKLLNPSNWVLKEYQEFTTVMKRALTTTCCPKEILIPAEYKTIHIVNPKRILDNKEKALLEKYTRQYLSYYKYDSREIVRGGCLTKKYQYKLSEEAKVKKVEVLSREVLAKKLYSIENQLITKGYLANNKKGNLVAIQKAMIRFQMANDLPIGQFDLISVDALLN